MTPDRWAQVKALFDAALGRPPTLRAAFLDEACAGDPSLRAEVEHLIASDARAGSFMAAAAFEPALTVVADSRDAFVGRRIGPYEIVREIGRGGMGAVYLAARADAAYRKQVAIKIVQHGLATEAIIASFRKERQILAGLEHPNIARLLDGGTTDGGLPYFVMEYVDGLPLDVFCDRRALSIDERLDLFRTVCSAVQDAHQHGVIHRDLKPSNILVTADGVPKLLDFGIAKVLNADVSLTTLGHTILARPLTPAYASPEQVRGEVVTPATDVYALGVMLYELLTGHRPYRLRTHTSQELQRVICEEEPERPSTVVHRVEEMPPAGDDGGITITPQSVSRSRREEPDQLRHRLAGDLDTIVLVALRKEPERRYASVEQLAEDVRRHREGRPIVARRSTLAYRTAKFVRRNRASVITAALSVMVMIVLATIVAWRWTATRTTRGGPPAVEATFTQLTSEPGMELYPSLSPDGRWLLYSSTASGHAAIYLRSVGGQLAINVTKDSPADDIQPAFSPDGERIAFRSERDGGGIFVMGRTGESVRRLTDSGFNPAWSPTGDEIVFAQDEVTIDPYRRRRPLSALWAVTVATGTKRLITKEDGVQPSWSPHGHRIAVWAVHGDRRDLWTVPAGGGPAVRATDDPSFKWNPIWSPDGQYLYFASDRSGTMNLWRVPIDETSGRVRGSPEAITTPAPFVGHLSIAANGRQLAYTSFLRTANLYTLGFDPSGKTVTGHAVPITVGTKMYWVPNLSPDGAWVVFGLADQSGIFVCRTDGTGLRQLTKDVDPSAVPRWSPDGSRIAFPSNRGGRSDIWSVRPDGSGLAPLTESADIRYTPVWSPDGSRMTVTGRTGVYLFDPRVPWTQQQPQALPPLPGGRLAVWSWSPDGTRLAGSAAVGAQGGIATYTITSRTYQTLTNFGSFPTWLNDNDSIVFQSDGKLFIVDHSKRVREFFAMPPDLIRTFDFSRDNRQMVFNRVVAEADVWLATLK